LGKDRENRTWSPPAYLIGDWLAIHAGKHIGGKPGDDALLAGLTDLRDLASWRTWPAEIPPLVPMDPREEVAHGFDLGSRPYFVQGQGDGRFALGPLL